MTRIRVGVLFGGRSGEHEVSIASATSIVRALDPEKYEAVPIGITRQGQWLIVDSPQELLTAEKQHKLPDGVEVLADVAQQEIVRRNGHSDVVRYQAADVVFPAMHGTYGEDGSIQGLLELTNIPYVGSGVAGSALAMDKVLMKHALSAAGLPGVAFCLVTRPEWRRDREVTLGRLESKLEYPMFVKPCNLGSSVGISKAHDRIELIEALETAARYDRRIIVEQGLDVREVECSVLGNDDPQVSMPGEVIAQHEFYDYEAKYTEGLSQLIVPAQLTAEQTRTVRDMAQRAFLAIDAAGLARIDFFIRRSDGTVLVNEINTMPGFTDTSWYPKLWEASGLSYPEIIDRLIQLAIERHAENQERSIEH
ncbi:MAG: D-alanine--D-alanine ligase family protein [Chloroflexota bacterium]